MKLDHFTVDKQITLIPLDDRWYSLPYDIHINLFIKGEGRIEYIAKKGFKFDGRSGGALVDFIVPNLGNQNEVACWLTHDIGAYALYLSCDEINELLSQMLIQSGISKFKAWLVKKAVGINTSWYGTPKPTDKEYSNLELISIRHYPK